MQLSILFFVILSFSSVYCSINTASRFDPAQEINCLAEKGGCSLFNSSIWANRLNPGNDEIFFINGSAPGVFSSPLLIYIPTNSTSIIGGLTLINTQFVIQSNSSLSVGYNIYAANYTTVVVEVNSVFVSGSNTIIPPTTVSFPDPVSSLNISGTFKAYSFTTLNAKLNLASTASASFDYITYNPSSISVTPPASINVTQLTVPQYANVQYPSGLSVVDIVVQSNSTLSVSQLPLRLSTVNVAKDAVVNFQGIIGLGSIAGNNPISGNGSINIVDSANISIIQTNGTAVSSALITVSNSYVYFEALELLSLIPDPQTTIFGNGLILHDVTSLGTIKAVTNGIIIKGLIESIGDFIVETSLNVEETAVLIGTPTLLSNSTVTTAGLIVVTNELIVPTNTTFIVSGSNSTFIGSLNNNGTLEFSEKSVLTMLVGNLTLSNGTVHATITDPKEPVLIVYNGSIIINGSTLSYKITKKPFFKSVNYLLAEIVGSGNIKGSFVGSVASPLDGSEVERPLSVQVNPQSVYLKYGFAVKDVDTWVWIVLGVSVAVVVGVIAAVIVKCRAHRHKYEPVR